MAALEKYLGKVYLWYYIPSLPAAIAFAILFAILTVAHGWRMLDTKLWFCFPFFLGGTFEIMGYLARAFAHASTGSMGPFIVQAIFLLLPPVLFAATLYMVYSRMVRAVGGERFSVVPSRWATRVFVLGDMLCLNIQSSGAGLTPKARLAKIGDAIIIAGLGLQVVMYAAFLACCIAFHIRFRAHSNRAKNVSCLPWKSCLGMLYATSLFIQVRNIFRMIEYAMGSEGYLFRNEWPTYTFDGALMLVVMVSFLVWYPSHFQAPDSASMELTDHLTISVP
ncbi:hypothetical protein M3J09_010355 [Ascochyta lentis]